MSINDRQLAFLRGQGYTGSINDAYRTYLLAQLGVTTGSIDDLLYNYLKVRWGYTGNLNDMMHAHLRYLGYTGSLSDMLRAAWGVAGIAGLSFSANLTTSLRPEYTGGSSAPTFTRATTATVFDNESVLRNVLSGEARFQGARRVRNFATEDIAAAWATKTATVSAVGVTDPLGGTTAYTITATGASQYAVQIFTDGGLTVRRTSLWIRRRTGTGSISLYYGDTNGGPSAVTVTSTWQRMTPTSVTAPMTGNGYVGVQIATSGDAVDVWHPQCEDVTGQSNQAPAEYVSVGVLSTPFHGAGVDGVKYFSTTNGNSVASNVVTEASGSPISASTLLGYLAEGARTNICLWSADLTNSTGGWLVGTTTPTANYVTAAGLSFTRLTGITAAAFLYRGITFTGDGTKAVSFFVRSDGVDGFGKFGLYDASTTTYRAKVRYTIASGVVSFSAEAGSGMTVDALAGGVYRCTIAAPGVVATNVNYLLPLANGEGTTLTSVQLTGIQAEDASFASTYIPTTTASVVRNADVLTYPTAGNISGTVGSVYVEVATGGSVTGPAGVVATTYPSGAPLYISSANTLLHDGATQIVASPAQTVAVNSSYKLASSWGGVEANFAKNGGASSGSVAFDGNLNVGADVRIGFWDTTQYFYGTIRNVRIYSAQLSASQLSAVTA